MSEAVGRFRRLMPTLQAYVHKMAEPRPIKATTEDKFETDGETIRPADENRVLYYDRRENNKRGGWVVIISRGHQAVRYVLAPQVLETQRAKAEEIAATKTFKWQGINHG